MKLHLQTIFIIILVSMPSKAQDFDSYKQSVQSRFESYKDQKEIEFADYPGEEWMSYGKLMPIDPYAIPYRCLYSRDVPNLFMAGRDISVTHVALGSVRVMRTCAMMGEVVGMAAAVCCRRGSMPRDVYTTWFQDLVELMKKGTGRTDVPYTQFYHQVDRTGHQAEDR